MFAINMTATHSLANGGRKSSAKDLCSCDPVDVTVSLLNHRGWGWTSLCHPLSFTVQGFANSD